MKIGGDVNYIVLEVLFANHAVARYESDRSEALVPGYTGKNYPSGFWIRRVYAEG